MLITGPMSSYLTLIMESQLRNLFEGRVGSLFWDTWLLLRRHRVSLYRDAFLQRVFPSRRLNDGVEALFYVCLLLLGVALIRSYENGRRQASV